MDALTRAVAAVGGVTKLAEIVGVSPSAPSMWKSRGRVPVEHCAEIERATEGAVTRQELRPDDWQRIWPELSAPAQEPARV